ncbi:MAG: class II aldolase/adducin family protein [Terriglobia bacterium]
MPADPREHLARIARLVFARRLTDSSGGNISLRAGDRVYMSPSHAGSRQQWQIEPGDVVALDFEGHVIDGPERRTREWQFHLGIYRALARAGAVIHAQGGHFMAFVAAGRPMPPVLEHTRKFGTIGVTPPAPAHSADLARIIVEAFRPSAETLEKHALAAFVPQHGIVVVGRDLDDAFDTLDRLETNAQAFLLGKLLGNPA